MPLRDLAMRTREVFHNGLKEFDASEASLEVMADRIFDLKESYKYLDACRKDVDKVKELMEYTLCAKMIATSCLDTVRTETVTATPRITMTAGLPAHGTPEYAQLVEKIPMNCMRPHWPSLCEWLTETQAAGKPLPEGLSPEKTVPKFSISCRKKNPE